MLTIYTPEIILSILTPILIIYAIMVIKQKRIKEVEEQQENIYIAIINQLIESEQNCFM